MRLIPAVTTLMLVTGAGLNWHSKGAPMEQVIGICLIAAPFIYAFSVQFYLLGNELIKYGTSK